MCWKSKGGASLKKIAARARGLSTGSLYILRTLEFTPTFSLTAQVNYDSCVFVRLGA